MKFIKEKNINLKSYFFLKVFLILLFFFILGIWTEKYNLLKKPSSFFTKIYENFYSKVVSEVYEVEEIVVDINYKNFEKIKKTREIALKNEILKASDSKWSAGKLVYNNKKNKIKIRLKGLYMDHWEHPYKWSFYIKIDDDKPSIFNLRRFTIQPPQTLNYIHEWLYMKALKKEGLIFHRTEFIDLIINGNKYGLYTLQERSMKELIENNKRREGPVITFSNQERLDEEINLDNTGANKISNYFWRSPIKPIQFKKSYKGTVQEKYLNKAVSLLELFRDKKLRVNEVFDVDQMAKVMALKAVFGSTEFDADDMKFYYNPVSNLLEPISKEVHADPKRFLGGFNSWVFNTNKLTYPRQKPFLDLFYDDKIFYEKYLNELNNYSNNDYISTIIEENKSEFEKLIRILKINFPTKEIFINNDFNNVSLFIQNTLNPVQKPYFNLLRVSNNILEFKATNTQILPIEITGINLGNKNLNFKSNLRVNGLNLNKKDFQRILKIDCLNLECNEINIDKVNVNYKILGQSKIYSSSIKFWNNDFDVKNFNNNRNQIAFLLDKYK